jgi:hypothetical protein
MSDWMLTNPNHAITTRRVRKGHYQIVITNVQSSKVLKILADAVQGGQNDGEFAAYCEGLAQGFMNPTSFERLFQINEEDAARIV